MGVNSRRALVMAAVWAVLGPGAGGAVLARPVPRQGDLRVLAIRAGFPDRPLRHPTAHFAGAPESLLDRLAAYWADASSGRLRLAVHLADHVVVVPGLRESYVQRPARLARDAIGAFVASAIGAPDRDALATAHVAIVFFAGAGRESHVQDGDRGDPWSNYTTVTPHVAGFDDAIVMAEEEVAPFSAFGVLCHEFGHQLGLPELYAPGAAAHEGIGVWGLMGQGTWLGRGDRPPHPEAWSKLQLGWVDVETVEHTTRGVEVPVVSETPRVVRIPAHPQRPWEYYLLERRARRGADASLPGEGVLVWHVDESRRSFRGAQIDPRHKMLHLVEADGRGDLDRGQAAGGNRGDAGDPWRGPSRWRRGVGTAALLAAALLVGLALLRLGWPRPLPGVAMRLGLAVLCGLAGGWLGRTPVCGPDTPGMAPYGDGPGRVVLRRFTEAGSVTRVDVLVAPETP